MGGMNKYKEIQMKIYGWPRNRTRVPCITSQVLYHWAIQADINGLFSPNYHPLTKSSPSKTHMTNTSSPCQDLLNTNAWTGKATVQNVVGVGGMNNTKKYKWKYMAGPGIEPRIPASLVRCSTTELSRAISTVHLAQTTTLERAGSEVVNQQLVWGNLLTEWGSNLYWLSL